MTTSCSWRVQRRLATVIWIALCVTVHGIEVDTELMEARLPRDKLDDALNLVTRFARRKKVTLREALRPD